MDDQLLDLYTDYLISSFGLVTATGLATLVGGSVSHDKITRFLASKPHTTADLWRIVKPFVRQIQAADGVMIIDDSIAEKPFSDENAIVCWHYDHAHDQMIKGINFLTCLYHVADISLPVGFEVIAKTETYIDKKDGKPKRRSPISKNELYQTLLRQAVQNQIPFRYVLNDVWYSAADNMKFVKHSLKKDFIMPLKANRKVAVGLEAKLHGQFVRVDALSLEPQTRLEVYLEGVAFALFLVKQVFVNKDGSTGVQYLVTSDANLTADEITTLYQKRWNGTVSQIAETECGLGKVAHPYRDDPNQSPLCRVMCVHQTRNAQSLDQTESLCFARQTLHGCTRSRLFAFGRTQTSASRCVT